MAKQKDFNSSDNGPPQDFAQAILALVWGKPWAPYILCLGILCMVAFAFWQSLPDSIKEAWINGNRPEIEATHGSDAAVEIVTEVPKATAASTALGDINKLISRAESNFEQLDGIDLHKDAIDALPDKYPKGFDLSFNPFGEAGKQSQALLTASLAILKRLESYELNDEEKEIAKTGHSWSTGLTADPIEVHRYTVQLAEALVSRRASARRKANGLQKEKERIVDAK